MYKIQNLKNYYVLTIILSYKIIVLNVTGVPKYTQKVILKEETDL